MSPSSFFINGGTGLPSISFTILNHHNIEKCVTEKSVKSKWQSREQRRGDDNSHGIEHEDKIQHQRINNDMRSLCLGSIVHQLLTITKPHIREFMGLELGNNTPNKDRLDSERKPNIDIITESDVATLKLVRLSCMLERTEQSLRTTYQLTQEYPHIRVTAEVADTYRRAWSLLDKGVTLLNDAIVSGRLSTLLEKQCCQRSEGTNVHGKIDSDRNCGCRSDDTKTSGGDTCITMNQTEIASDATATISADCGCDTAERRRKIEDITSNTDTLFPELNEVYSLLSSAYSLSQQLETEESLHPQPYFPLEQQLAIYAPYWIPITIPLLRELFTEFRRRRANMPVAVGGG
jgi:hypothetical protein